MTNHNLKSRLRRGGIAVVGAALCAGLAMASAALADPVGMTCHLAGHPSVRQAGGGWQALHLLQRLDVGDAIRCGGGDQAVIVIFASGARYVVGAGKSATVEQAAVAGAVPLAGLSGPSAHVARSLGASRVGAVMARPAISHERLTPHAPGWLPEGQRHFAWTPDPGAAGYSFTLFDWHDNVIWGTRVSEAQADYPADLPALATREPYVWRLVPFGHSGRPQSQTRWGIVTFLSASDSEQLAGDAASLIEMANSHPDDPTSLLLLAELYRRYGVLERTLETLEDSRLQDQAGVDDALDATYAQIGRYAQALSGRAPHPTN